MARGSPGPMPAAAGRIEVRGSRIGRTRSPRTYAGTVALRTTTPWRGRCRRIEAQLASWPGPSRRRSAPWPRPVPPAPRRGGRTGRGWPPRARAVAPRSERDRGGRRPRAPAAPGSCARSWRARRRGGSGSPAAAAARSRSSTAGSGCPRRAPGRTTRRRSAAAPRRGEGAQAQQVVLGQRAAALAAGDHRRLSGLGEPGQLGGDSPAHDAAARPHQGPPRLGEQPGRLLRGLVVHRVPREPRRRGRRRGGPARRYGTPHAACPAGCRPRGCSRGPGPDGRACVQVESLGGPGPHISRGYSRQSGSGGRI